MGSSLKLCIKQFTFGLNLVLTVVFLKEALKEVDFKKFPSGAPADKTKSDFIRVEIKKGITRTIFSS